MTECPPTPHWKPAAGEGGCDSQSSAPQAMQVDNDEFRDMLCNLIRLCLPQGRTTVYPRELRDAWLLLKVLEAPLLSPRLREGLFLKHAPPAAAGEAHGGGAGTARPAGGGLHTQQRAAARRRPGVRAAVAADVTSSLCSCDSIARPRSAAAWGSSPLTRSPPRAHSPRRGPTFGRRSRRGTPRCGWARPLSRVRCFRCRQHSRPVGAGVRFRLARGGGGGGQGGGGVHRGGASCGGQGCGGAGGAHRYRRRCRRRCGPGKRSGEPPRVFEIARGVRVSAQLRSDGCPYALRAGRRLASRRRRAGVDRRQADRPHRKDAAPRDPSQAEGRRESAMGAAGLA